jgi:hypothetical protein
VIATGLSLALAVAISTAPVADEHLLAGAGAFREGRFDAALVEFRVAERLGAADASPYAAAALVQLGRPEEAVEAFASSPPGDDDLLDWYRALACYEARLYTCASHLADSLKLSGPKAAPALAKLRADLARVLAPEPQQASIDWYVGRCEDLRQRGRGALAAAYCREAADLGERRTDRYGVARASAVLTRLVAGARHGEAKP